MVERRFEEEEAERTRVLKEQINTPGVNVQSLIKKNSEVFQNAKRKNAGHLALLDPKIQIARIFPSLFVSLIFIMLYRIVDRNPAGTIDWFYSKILLLMSFVCSGIGVLLLKRVAWAVIDVKREIAMEKKLESGDINEQAKIFNKKG